jgi:hypothetical protein
LRRASTFLQKKALKKGMRQFLGRNAASFVQPMALVGIAGLLLFL